jgi:hypothetical protein
LFRLDRLIIVFCKVPSNYYTKHLDINVIKLVDIEVRD